MNISKSEENGVQVVKLEGDLDVYSTADVEAALQDALENAQSLVIDISGVPFADSAGLGSLIGVYKRAKSENKEVKLRKPTQMVNEILTITRMKRFFPVEE